MKINALIPRAIPRVFKAPQALSQVYPYIMALPAKDNVYKNIRYTIITIAIL
jgi:hypothetical protein